MFAIRDKLKSFIAVALVGAIAGCGQSGPKIVPVSGTVIMNNEVLTGYDGFVRIVPQGGRAATGQIDPETGRFTLTTYESEDGCLVGNHKAAVIVNVMVTADKLLWLIPEHYGNYNTSDLTVNIEGETDSLEIRLEGELLPPPKQRPKNEDLDDEFID